jgi:chemotaxis protein CheD
MLRTSRNITVQVSDARVSKDPDSVLVTYSLGSCIAAAFYDPAIRIGGMIHYQLPSSTMDPARAAREPLMFADTGMKLLLDHLVSSVCRPQTHHCQTGRRCSHGQRPQRV